jgi:hypothetical protein
MGIYLGKISLASSDKSTYQLAKEAGYTGTAEEFNKMLANLPQIIANQQNHLQDFDNPHKVDAEHVNTYTKEQIDSLINENIGDVLGGSY